MQPNASSGPVLPFAWAEVLEKVETTLAQAEAEAAQSEQSLGSAEEPGNPAWQTAFDRLEERFRQLQGCIAEAELNATQAEKPLQHGEDLLKRWLAEAEAMQRRLANEAGASL